LFNKFGSIGVFGMNEEDLLPAVNGELFEKLFKSFV
jgi:hypothetical protein